jgi:hypothetical protein
MAMILDSFPDLASYKDDRVIRYLLTIIDGNRRRKRGTPNPLEKLNKTFEVPEIPDVDEIWKILKEDEESFDRQHRSNTGTNWPEYVPIPVHVLRTILDEIVTLFGVKPSECSLVDVGSGKGGVLLQAAERSFKSLVGVELKKTLHEIAASNVAQYSSLVGRDLSIQLHNTNVTEFSDYPENNLLFWLFNPLPRPVAQQFMNKIESVARAKPRHMIFFYVIPLYEDVFTESSLLKRVTGRFLDDPLSPHLRPEDFRDTKGFLSRLGATEFGRYLLRRLTPDLLREVKLALENEPGAERMQGVTPRLADEINRLVRLGAFFDDRHEFGKGDPVLEWIARFPTTERTTLNRLVLHWGFQDELRFPDGIYYYSCFETRE